MLSQERGSANDTDGVAGTALFTLFSPIAAVSTSVSSGFAASDGSVSFALNIPQADDNNDLYFAIQVSAIIGARCGMIV